MPLTLAAVGEENIIRKIGGKPEVRAHLENLGFVAGGIVHGDFNNRRKPDRQRKGFPLAISRERANKIMV